MASYKPYIKKSNGTVDELPLDATTLGGVELGIYKPKNYTYEETDELIKEDEVLTE